MKKITLDEFETYCNKFFLKKKILFYDADQDSFRLTDTIRHKLLFSRVDITDFPTRISLIGDGGYVRFFFVDSIHLINNDTENPQFKITCGNTPYHISKFSYIISFV